MVETIQLTLLDFVEHRKVAVEDGLVVQDEGDVFITELPSELTFEYDGTIHKLTGNRASLNQLINKALDAAVFGEWFENHWADDFEDLGLEAPRVYDWEEDQYFKVRSIDNYIHNCKYDENYSKVIKSLHRLAAAEFEVELLVGEDFNVEIN